MTPEEFIAKWRNVELSERAASQDHFNELCDLLEIKKPTNADPTGEHFAFEKAVPNAGKGGGSGFADVWRKGCFVWEYKRKGKFTTLAAALAQARDYADLLEHPPLAIACDIDEFQIRTLFTGSVSVTTRIRLGDLADVGTRNLLRRCFTDPQSFKPQITPQTVTEEAARKFATLAQGLRDRKDRIGQPHDARRVAHFLNKIVFCLFAEDAGLLPGNVFSAVVEEAIRDREVLTPMLADLFGKMRTGKGFFGTVKIPWFNGGLFDDDDVLELMFTEVRTLSDATLLDWKSIEPVIFGTLFERGLDPAKRKEMAGLFDSTPANGKIDQGKPSKTRKKAAAPAPPTLAMPGGATAAQRSLGQGVGIHYTDSATIMKIIEPVVLRPLAVEWETVKAAITQAKRVSRKDDLYLAFRERLGAFRVLDPACGSGNFLYLALRHLKDFDKLVEQEGKALGAASDPNGQRITPKTVLGLEINPYAAELARVTVWIGELQWQMQNAYGVRREPILSSLDGIENRDALLNTDGSAAHWPSATVIIGNPPFLGEKLWRRRLGDEYTETIRRAYKDVVPPRADLVCYWLEKARRLCKESPKLTFGLVATKAIAKGDSRHALELIVDDPTLCIFDAWTNEPWVVEGAQVRVSMVCVGSEATGARLGRKLNGKPVPNILSDLTEGARGFDATKAAGLEENSGVSFQGLKLGGPFSIADETARQLLASTGNPNGRQNSEVVKILYDVDDVVGRPTHDWVIDFSALTTETEAASYEAPFELIRKRDAESSEESRSRKAVGKSWRLVRPRPALRKAVSNLKRYLLTPETSKYRLFRFVAPQILPAGSLFAIARDDDTSFGLLQSIVHELWSTAQGNRLGKGNDRRYNSTVTFETFPFPEGLTPNISAIGYEKDPRAKRIGTTAAKLNELRESWLNPADLVKREPEIVLGYPERIAPKNQTFAMALSKRTLTDLYNERPTWLVHAHRDLDRAVAAAYGWPESLADRAQPENLDAMDRKAAEEEILRQLFALNQARSRTKTN